MEAAQTSLLYAGPETTTDKFGKPRSHSRRYSVRFLIITGIMGLLCLIAAIPLTIVGTIGLRDYGFSNSPLIAGIVLFGAGGVFSIVTCVAAGLK